MHSDAILGRAAFREQMLKISDIGFSRVIRVGPLLLFLLTGGCIRFHNQVAHKTIEPLPATFANEIAYEKSQCSLIEERVVQTNDHFKIVRECFRVPFEGTNKNLELDCYLPHGRTNLPVVMLLPISGGGYFLERHFAEYFVKHDFAPIIVRREKGPKYCSQTNVEAELKPGKQRTSQ